MVVVMLTVVMVITRLIVGNDDSNDAGDVNDGGVDSNIGNDANCCDDRSKVDCNEDTPIADSNSNLVVVPVMMVVVILMMMIEMVMIVMVEVMIVLMDIN